MGLVERLFGRAGVSAAASWTPPGTPAPMPVPYLDSRSAVGLSAVWRCVSLIADTIADMPWTEWKGDDKLDSSRLVKRPMATMTRREWTWRIVATEALFNTVYCLHVGGYDRQGTPWSLLPIPPAAIMPFGYMDPWGILPPTEYIVGGAKYPVEALTIIHRAPFPGQREGDKNGIIDLARRQFSAYLAADTAMSRYWQAGGPTTTVITTEQELDGPEAEAIAARWVARRSQGADYPAVLGRGAKAEPWGADPTTESAVEARRDQVADIGRYFGVPTRILNAPAGDSETYSNVENDAVDLLRYTLRGYMGPVEDAISELLPGDYIGGRRMELDPSRLIQGDLASRAKAGLELITSGIYSLPEARVRLFGLPPVPVPVDPEELAEGAAPASPMAAPTMVTATIGGT